MGGEGALAVPWSFESDPRWIVAARRLAFGLFDQDTLVAHQYLQFGDVLRKRISHIQHTSSIAERGRSGNPRTGVFQTWVQKGACGFSRTVSCEGSMDRPRRERWMLERAEAGPSTGAHRLEVAPASVDDVGLDHAMAHRLLGDLQRAVMALQEMALRAQAGQLRRLARGSRTSYAESAGTDWNVAVRPLAGLSLASCARLGSLDLRVL